MAVMYGHIPERLCATYCYNMTMLCRKDVYVLIYQKTIGASCPAGIGALRVYNYIINYALHKRAASCMYTCLAIYYIKLCSIGKVLCIYMCVALDRNHSTEMRAICTCVQ